MEFELVTSTYAGVILFLAYFVRGIAGFGSGLISVPLLSFMFPVQIVVPLVVFLDYVGSASQGIRNRNLIAWREQLPLIPFSALGVAIGLMLLKAMTSALLAQALGAFVIAFAVYQLLPLPELRGSRLFAVPCGLFGGLIGTLFGTGGPFYVIYLGLRGLEKSTFRATFAANFLIDSAIRLAAYALFGFFFRDLIVAMLGALPIVGAALWMGGRAHSEMSRESYTKLISVLLLGSGVVLLLKD